MAQTGWFLANAAGWPALLANHWTTGSGGFEPGLIVLLLSPYLVLGLGAVLLVRHLRRNGS